MNRPHLRNLPRISYYEPEEPNFDEYTYCEECSDFVYEYCSLHGPLLVIPDDKVPTISPYPAYVPRAALTIPHVFLHLAHSIIPGAGLGVFSTLTLPRGVRFGPYCGERTQEVDSMYCWQIYKSNNKRSHVVDAADANSSNWMRYVNCARHSKEQNLLAYQYQGQLYYRTIKIIPRFTELMVFYGSEYANVLQINLSKYNKKQYYEDIIRTSKVYESKNHKNNTNQLSEATHTNIEEIEELIDTEQFVLIDDEDLSNENNINETFESITNTDDILPNIDDDSTIKVNYDGDNIIIDFVVNKTDKKIIKCDICDKTFSRHYSLTRHNIRIHSKEYNDEENKYKCQICEKKFRKRVNLIQHTQTHLGSIDGRLFQCNICEKQFNKKRYMKRHYLTHTKLYKCEFCEYRTDLESHYKEHLDKHTKHYKYSCETCFYKTNISKNFKQHRFRHDNGPIKRAYQFETLKKCKICDFETINRKSYSVHEAKHRGDIIKCNLCDYSTYNRENLKNHCKRIHYK